MGTRQWGTLQLKIINIVYIAKTSWYNESAVSEPHYNEQLLYTLLNDNRKCIFYVFFPIFRTAIAF